jgi:hypothetical protein
MIKNLASFNAALEKTIQTLPVEGALRLQRMIALEALKRIVLKTPVDTGRARGNWQTTINNPAVGEKQSNTPIMDGSTVIGSLKSFGTIFIANNLVYILPLEHGHSQQAPNGMVAVTIEELRSMFPT